MEKLQILKQRVKAIIDSNYEDVSARVALFAIEKEIDKLLEEGSEPLGEKTVNAIDLMPEPDLSHRAAVYLENANIAGDTMVAMNHCLDEVPIESQGSYYLADLLAMFVENEDKFLTIKGEDKQNQLQVQQQIHLAYHQYYSEKSIDIIQLGAKVKNLLKGLEKGEDKDAAPTCECGREMYVKCFCEICDNDN